VSLGAGEATAMVDPILGDLLDKFDSNEIMIKSKAETINPKRKYGKKKKLQNNKKWVKYVLFFCTSGESQESKNS
jgi:hypothetical protein